MWVYFSDGYFNAHRGRRRQREKIMRAKRPSQLQPSRGISKHMNRESTYPTSLSRCSHPPDRSSISTWWTSMTKWPSWFLHWSSIIKFKGNQNQGGCGDTCILFWITLLQMLMSGILFINDLVLMHHCRLRFSCARYSRNVWALKRDHGKRHSLLLIVQGRQRMKGKGEEERERGMSRLEGKEGAFPIEYSVAQQWLARKGNKNSLVQALMHFLHQMRTSVPAIHALAKPGSALPFEIAASSPADTHYSKHGSNRTIWFSHLDHYCGTSWASSGADFPQRFWLALASPGTANLFTEAH